MEAGHGEIETSLAEAQLQIRKNVSKRSMHRRFDAE